VGAALFFAFIDKNTRSAERKFKSATTTSTENL
jgi:hypothetical protein